MNSDILATQNLIDEASDPSEAKHSTDATATGVVTELDHSQPAILVTEEPQPGHTATPYAIVLGKPVLSLPVDLYIPPDALRVMLESFQGPLDLLLYLIKRQNLDILDIPIAKITQQYVEYINLMQDMQIELAAEYLVMAAMLAEIKSRLLLPRTEEEEENEVDPRVELIRRLQEYEQIKAAADKIDALPRLQRDCFLVDMDAESLVEFHQPEPEVSMKELCLAFAEVLRRADQQTHHKVAQEQLSVRERMTHLLSALREKSYLEFKNCFALEEGRMGVVVTFIAILELLKQALIEVVQAQEYGPIHIKGAM